VYNDAANPVLVGGAGITFLRSFAGIVAGDIAGTIGAEARMGDHPLPLTECAT
jgi:ABC-type amino acid transport system permease subunit